MKEVPVEHKLEQFSFGSLRRRQELWKLLSSLHLCRSPAPSWPGKQSQLCLLAAGSPGEAHRCLLSAPYLKTWSSSPLGRRQSRWQGGCLRTYAETLKRAVWKVPACWEVGNWLGLLSFFFCAEKEGFELFYDQSWFKERWLHHQSFHQKNNPNFRTFNQTIESRAVQKQRVSQRLQTIARILTVHKVCQCIG